MHSCGCKMPSIPCCNAQRSDIMAQVRPTANGVLHVIDSVLHPVNMRNAYEVGPPHAHAPQGVRNAYLLARQLPSTPSMASCSGHHTAHTCAQCALACDSWRRAGSSGVALYYRVFPRAGAMGLRRASAVGVERRGMTGFAPTGACCVTVLVQCVHGLARYARHGNRASNDREVPPTPPAHTHTLASASFQHSKVPQCMPMPAVKAAVVGMVPPQPAAMPTANRISGKARQGRAGQGSLRHGRGAGLPPQGTDGLGAGQRPVSAAAQARD
jgi:hypothetical protein